MERREQVKKKSDERNVEISRKREKKERGSRSWTQEERNEENG